jgi:hypothetical protein
MKQQERNILSLGNHNKGAVAQSWFAFGDGKLSCRFSV